MNCVCYFWSYYLVHVYLFCNYLAIFTTSSGYIFLLLHLMSVIVSAPKYMKFITYLITVLITNVKLNDGFFVIMLVRFCYTFFPYWNKVFLFFQILARLSSFVLSTCWFQFFFWTFIHLLTLYIKFLCLYTEMEVDTLMNVFGHFQLYLYSLTQAISNYNGVFQGRFKFQRAFLQFV